MLEECGPFAYPRAGSGNAAFSPTRCGLPSPSRLKRQTVEACRRKLAEHPAPAVFGTTVASENSATPKGRGRNALNAASARRNETCASRSRTSSSKYNSGIPVTMSTSAANLSRRRGMRSQQLGQLETGECARHAHKLVEVGWRSPSLARQPRQQQRIEAVCSVQIEHALAVRQRVRQKIVREAGRFRPSVEHGKARAGQHPGLRQARGVRARGTGKRDHDGLPSAPGNFWGRL